MVSNEAKFKMSLIHQKNRKKINFLPAIDLSPRITDCSFHSLGSTLQKKGVDSFNTSNDFYPINPSKQAVEV